MYMYFDIVGNQLTKLRNHMCRILIIQWCLMIISWNRAKGVEWGEPIGDMAKKYKMESICGITVNMATDNIYVAEVNLRGGRDSPNCSLIIKPGLWTNQSWSCLSMQFRDFRIVDDSIVTLSRLNEYGIPTGVIRQCSRGHYYECSRDSIYVGCGQSQLLIEFQEKRTVNYQQTVIFGIAVSIFRLVTSEPCSQHKCRGQYGRCIPNELMCRGYDACGDDSDCLVTKEPAKKNLLSKGTIIGISLLAAAIAVTLLYGCYRRYQKSEELDDGDSSYVADDLPEHQNSPVPLGNNDIEVHSSRSRNPSIDVNSSLYREYWEDDNEADTRRPIMEPGHHSNPARNNYQETPMPSAPPLPKDVTPTAHPLSHDPFHITDAIVEPTNSVDANTPTSVVNDFDAPPPSYDEFMSHVDFYKTSAKDSTHAT